jgi:hypothetical protein
LRTYVEGAERKIERGGWKAVKICSGCLLILRGNGLLSLCYLEILDRPSLTLTRFLTSTRAIEAILGSLCTAITREN